MTEARAMLESALAADPIVALAGIEALMEVGGDVAAELVRPALRRSEPDVVRSAVACLGAHASPDALTEIPELLSHADWSVRAEAVQVLSDRSVRKGLPSLLRRLEVEDDSFVREAILRAVERLEE